MNGLTSAITIDEVFPWGRSLDEYCRMFTLREAELGSRILACADGPASFNAEMAEQGRRVVSCDPLYRYDGDEIRSRVEKTHAVMVANASRNASRFRWDRIHSPQHLGEVRLKAMGRFLEDFELGKRQGRYLDYSLPNLPFPDQSFDLVLCSHFLFLYTQTLSLEFHIASVLEMSRVATEVRIFPVLDMEGAASAHLGPLLRRLESVGMATRIDKVDYEFLQGGNQMLRIQRRFVG